jgi:hypothetical protein
VIRFSAFLVVAAIGLLVAGVVTSRLLLVYVAIGVSAAALLALGAGTLLKRGELFGQPETAEPKAARPEAAGAHLLSQPQQPPWVTAVPAGSGPAASAWPAVAQAGPSKAGYLPAAADATAGTPGAATAWGNGIPAPAFPDPRPADVQRPPAAFTPPPAAPAPSPAPSAWERRHQAPPAQPTADQLSAERLQPTGRLQPPADDQSATDQLSQKDQPTENQLPAEHLQPGEDHQPAEDHKPSEPQQSSEPRSATEPGPPAGPEPPGEAVTSASADDADEPAASAVPAPAFPGTPEPLVAEADLQREVTVVPGVPRYHRANCILIRFMDEKDLDQTTPGAAREGGCTPCRACLPDQDEATPA